MEVQLVRRRHRRGTHVQQLQALRKRLVLRMDDIESRQQQLRVCVPTSVDGSRPHEPVLLQASRCEIKAVRIKRRLMRITMIQGDRAFLLRFKDDVDALTCGERFMTIWGIDPMVETFAQDTATQTDSQEELKELTRQYLTNERFRSLVNQMHAKMEASTQEWEF